jgi:hypothetical protein
MNGEGSFDLTPRYQRKLDIPINFETGRARGFVPTLDFDLNGDGRRDFLSSTDGTALEIFLGHEGPGTFRRAARQRVDTTGTLSVGDWNGDGLPDLLLFDPRQPNHPIRLLRNLGTLPGGPPGTPAGGE